MQSLHFNTFKKAAILTFLTAILLFLLVAIQGKVPLFLWLNRDLGRQSDIFFEYWTNLGDGSVFIPLLVLFIIYCKKYIPLLIGGFVFSTLFTHLFKDLLMPGEPRPLKGVPDFSLVHTVPGVEVHAIGSFPSGHTTTAFTVFLIGSLVIQKKWLIPVGFIYALLVGYSRIYLAQHFPTDVAGGMIAALITLFCSLGFQLWWEKKIKKA